MSVKISSKEIINPIIFGFFLKRINLNLVEMN